MGRDLPQGTIQADECDRYGAAIATHKDGEKGKCYAYGESEKEKSKNEMSKEPYVSSECLQGFHGDCGVAACKDECHDTEVEEDEDENDEIF